MTHRDLVSGPRGRSGCEGDGDPSSSVCDAPSGPEDPKGRHDESLSVSFGIMVLSHGLTDGA